MLDVGSWMLVKKRRAGAHSQPTSNIQPPFLTNLNRVRHHAQHSAAQQTSDLRLFQDLVERRNPRFEQALRGAAECDIEYATLRRIGQDRDFLLPCNLGSLLHKVDGAIDSTQP